MKIEGIYSPSDLVKILDVSDSTLRKWCIAIELQGYLFNRTDNNKRVFVDRDLVVLKHFRNLVQVQFMTLENAANIVATKYQDIRSTGNANSNNENDERLLPDIADRIFERFERLEATNKQLEETNKQLIARLNEQQKLIEDYFNKRDTLFLESIKETQLQLLQEAKEEEKHKKPRKGLLKWFTKED